MTPFIPPELYLMGPGPSNVSPRVLAAMARPTIGHLDPDFIRIMNEVKDLLRMAMRTKNSFTLPVSAPGSAGMEACFVNLLEPGDHALICVNGVFGTRMVQIAQRCGAHVTVVEDEWGTPISLEKVADALTSGTDYKVVAAVHAETSTGVCSDVAAIAALAQKVGALSIIDAVTSLGGIELNVDAWGIDALYSGTQKCLSCPPGLSPVSFSERALTALKARQTPPQSWFLDFSLLTAYWQGDGARAYHHTAPINMIYALHESLLALHEEGLQASWARHKSISESFQAELSALGFEFLVEADHRLPQLLSLKIPPQIKDEAATRTYLRQRHNLEIGAGLGPLAGKVWRIGVMGYGASEKNTAQCLAAFKDVLANH